MINRQPQHEQHMCVRDQGPHRIGDATGSAASRLVSTAAPELPAELLHLCFRTLELHDLFAAAAVCTQWRTATEVTEKHAENLWRAAGACYFSGRLAALRRQADYDRPQMLSLSFEQPWTPAELVTQRKPFGAGLSLETCTAARWREHCAEFGAALLVDPFQGKTMRPSALQCAAGEAAAAAGHSGCRLTCGPLAYCRHIIPSKRWAMCFGCARLLCDDCANDVLLGAGMTRCAGCQRLFCAACDFADSVRFCDTCESSWCRNCADVRAVCAVCSTARCDKCAASASCPFDGGGDRSCALKLACPTECECTSGIETASCDPLLLPTSTNRQQTSRIAEGCPPRSARGHTASPTQSSIGVGVTKEMQTMSNPWSDDESISECELAGGRESIAPAHSDVDSESEMEALTTVADLRTPPELFSAQLAAEFDTMFAGLDMGSRANERIHRVGDAEDPTLDVDQVKAARAVM